MEILLDTALQKLISGNREEINSYLREVCKNVNIRETRADMHIYMLHLDGNNRPRVNDLAVFLSCCIVDYCIPKSEIAEANSKDIANNTKQYTTGLVKKAKNLFTDLKNSGEGGELLLSIMSQRILGIPQLLCKMPLKTNSEVHYHGADGLYGKYDSKAKKFCLYWAESKIYDKLDTALTNCFDSIKDLLVEEGAEGTKRTRDLEIFRDNIDFDNEELEDAILEYLNPNSTQYLSLEYRGICLVGYNEDAYPKDMSSVEDEVYESIKEKIETFQDKIGSRLKSKNPLDKFKIEVLLVPFSDVEEFRKRFLEEI